MRKPAAAANAVFSCLFLWIAATTQAMDRAPRVVTVELVVDQAVPDILHWRYQANRFFDGTIRVFQKQFGIRLAIGDSVRWQPEKEKKSMADALLELRTKVQPGDSDIVLGVIDPSRIQPLSLGIASYPHGYILLCNICLSRGQTKKAINEYTTALRFQPREPGIHFNLGLAYIQERLFKEAADECRAAIELNPDFVRARVALARLLLAAGDSQAAASECRVALKSDPQSAEALCVLGTVLVAQWRPSRF